MINEHDDELHFLWVRHFIVLASCNGIFFSRRIRSLAPVCFLVLVGGWVGWGGWVLVFFFW